MLVKYGLEKLFVLKVENLALEFVGKRGQDEWWKVELSILIGLRENEARRNRAKLDDKVRKRLVKGI